MNHDTATPVPLTTKVLWLVAFGLFAYVVEYGLDVTRVPFGKLFIFLILPFLFLFAASRIGPGLSGKLRSGNPDPEPPPDPNRKNHAGFVLIVILYVGIYINVLIRVFPREIESRRGYRVYFLDLLDSFSPVEFYWLIAPLILLWWYRQRSSASHQDLP
ncbi:MAG: hypothetical protein AAF351_13165 [Pseudomonadota bacterium]